MTDKGHLAHDDLPAEVLTCRTHPRGREKKGRKGRREGGREERRAPVAKNQRESRRCRKDGGEVQNKHVNQTKCHVLASFSPKKLGS